ncbi:GNAT family N-acetyltransferase, partial [Thioclava sp. BHET1]
GRGLSRLMLEHLIAAARAEGLLRLSLETGVEAEFIPARGLYARAGFVECGPYEGYVEDPNSVFMSLALAAE